MNRETFDSTIQTMNVSSEPNLAFYAQILSRCKVTFDNKIPAPAGVRLMGTYYELMINEEIFSKFKLSKRIFIMCHEVLHIVNNHFFRIKNRNPQLWNYCTDASINDLLMNKTGSYKSMPDCGITSKTIKMPENKSAEQYYRALYENAEKISIPDGKGTIDDHSAWAEKSEENPNGSTFLGDELTKKITENMVRESFEKTKGNVSQDLSALIEEIFEKEEISWKKILRNIFSNKKSFKTTTWKKKSRRFPDFDEVKGVRKDNKLSVCVIADVSGSIDDKFLAKTLNEVRGLCKQTRSDINVIQVDTEVKSVTEIKKKSEIKKIKRNGSGGTHLYPGLQYIRKENLVCDVLLVFTDGCIEDKWPEPPKCKTIFILEKNQTLSLNFNNWKKQPIVFNVK